MKKLELLAPAGNLEALKAAVYGGCDAAYIGGKFFGARSYAGNFSLEEIKEAVTFCHLYGVKLYITVNTLVYENEVKAFEEYIDELVQCHVDALIMQDLGMIHLVRTIYPDLEIHASTQMHIHTVEGVLEAEKLGLKRVVLARETSIDLIRKIKDETNIELEVFGHGALCMGYSGQCFMSFLLGGRSGNRGTCAQCCRQKYTLLSKEGKQEAAGYLLSMKDLNTLPYIQDFIEAGIASLKIEGRMKRPEYVFKVTSIYRKAIDAYYETGKATYHAEDIEEMAKLFNRGFTKGFLFNEENRNVVNDYRPNHMGIPIGKVVQQTKDRVTVRLMKGKTLSKQDGIRILNEVKDVGCTVYQMFQNGKPVSKVTTGDVTFSIKGQVKVNDEVTLTTDNRQLEKIRLSQGKEARKVGIHGHIIIHKNEKIQFCLQEGKHRVEVWSENAIAKADKVPTTREMVERSLRKLGNTVYAYDTLKIEVEEGLFVPAHTLNILRRAGIETLTQKRLYRQDLEKKPYHVEKISVPLTKTISAFIETEEQYYQIKDIVDFIYMEEPLYQKWQKNKKTIQKLPRIMKTYKKTREPLLIGELGSLYLYPNSHTDFSFGVTNSYTLYFLHASQASKITLSPELNQYQIEKMMKAYEKRYHAKPNTEWIVYGYIEAMILKYNLLANHHLEEGSLQDRFLNRYLVKDKKEYNILYHYAPYKEKNIAEIEA